MKRISQLQRKLSKVYFLFVNKIENQGSIATVKQQLTMLQGKITIGSDEEQLQTARNIVAMIQTTVQVLLK